MKVANKLVLLFVMLFLLGACATGPKFSEYSAQIPAPNPDLGRIYFYRPSAAAPVLKPNVVLNNETVGEAIPHGFFYVDRTPGDYEAVTTTEVARKVSFSLEKGQTRYIRFRVGIGFFVGHVYGELVDEQTGQSEISKCKFTGQTNEKQDKN